MPPPLTIPENYFAYVREWRENDVRNRQFCKEVLSSNPLLPSFNHAISTACQQSLDSLIRSDLDRQDCSEGLAKLIELVQSLFLKLDSSNPAASNFDSSVSAKEKRKSDWNAEKLEILEWLLKVVKQVPLFKIFDTVAQREHIINLCVKPAHRILEGDKSVVLKLKNVAFTLIGHCIKEHSHGFGAQTNILQNLQYYEASSVTMAELVLHVINMFNHSALVDQLLREISARSFKQDDGIAPRSFGRFLVRLAQDAPLVLHKHMVLLVKHLDCEAYPMRNALVEVIGLVAAHVATTLENQDDDEQLRNALERYLELLEERALDLNSYVRSKLLQVLTQLCECRGKFPKHRQIWLQTAVDRMQDKSSQVRTHAIELLTRLIITHPFVMDGGELKLEEFKKRLELIQKEIDGMDLPAEFKVTAEDTHQPMMYDDDGDDDGEEMDLDKATSKALEPEQMLRFNALQVQRKYYKDAIEFTEKLEYACSFVLPLLASTVKSEVNEAMEFFVAGYRYGLGQAKEGVTKMVHLIWSKETTGERSIKNRLIASYKELYFITSENNPTGEVNQITKNLLSLTEEATFADLTSLEMLLSVMMQEGFISNEVEQKLWQIYGAQRTDIPAKQRRGSIMILSMLARAKPKMIEDNLDLLQRVGLGSHGQSDLKLAMYTCKAVQRIDHVRFPNHSNLFVKLGQFIIAQTKLSLDWFPLVEQALSAIYQLAEHPDQLAEALLKELSRQSFYAEHPDTIEASTLSRLLFVVGHIAIKQLVYMDLIEQQVKKQSTRTAVEGAEDEVTETMRVLRERELLFGPTALLGKFGPLVRRICASSTKYQHPLLQKVAMLTLAKLMCVSAKFCEANLALFLTILEKSPDSSIRCNLTIGLGDLAVCFNTLLEDHMFYLFARLSDESTQVRKNALMVLTHLILNGMIKVKGQLGEMARCLIDPDARISDLAKLFFTELANKEISLAGYIPDIISQLSMGVNAVNEAGFQEILRFLFELIKNSDNLIDKLCLRFKFASDPRQWRDTSFCLGLIPFKSEKALNKLVDHFPLYQDKLLDDAVYKNFQDISSRLKKSGKGEWRVLLDQFEAQLKTQRQVLLEMQMVMQTGKLDLMMVDEPPRPPVLRARATPSRRKKLLDHMESDSESGGDVSEEDEMDLMRTLPPPDPAEPLTQTQQVEVEMEAEVGEGEGEEEQEEEEEEAVVEKSTKRKPSSRKVFFV